MAVQFDGGVVLGADTRTSGGMSCTFLCGQGLTVFGQQGNGDIIACIMESFNV